METLREDEEIMVDSRAETDSDEEFYQTPSKSFGEIEDWSIYGLPREDIEILTSQNIAPSQLESLTEEDMKEIKLTRGSIIMLRNARSSLMQEKKTSKHEPKYAKATINNRVPYFRGQDSKNSCDSPKEFILRFELAMRSAGINESDWPLLMLQQIVQITDLEWLMTEVGSTTTWSDAKQIFIGHFEKPNYRLVKAAQLASMKQEKDETLQSYCDRFKITQKQAGIPDSLHTVQMFKQGLRNPKLVKEIRRRESLRNPIERTQGIIDVALDAEGMMEIDSYHIIPKKSSIPHNSASPTKYYCKFHNSTKVRHNTEDCKGLGVTKKTSNNNSNSEEENKKHRLSVTCFKCKQKGHYAPDCPNRDLKSAHIDTEQQDDAFTCVIYINEKPLEALIDTGANCSFINAELVKKLDLRTESIKGYITLAGGNKIPRTSTTEDIIIKANNNSVKTKLEILDMKEQIILGRDLIKAFNIMIGNIPCNDHDHKLDVDEEEIVPIEQNTEENNKSILEAIKQEIELNQEISGFCDMPEALVRLDTPIGKTSYTPQYSIPYAWHSRIDAQLEKWKESNVIIKAPPGCKFNNPLLAVAKKTNGVIDDSKIRLCVDVRNLNHLLPEDKFPIPSIKSLIERLKDCQYITTIDCDQSYHTLPILKEHQHKTSFTWKNDNFMFQGAPFGIKTITSVFQRTMIRLLEPYNQFSFNYIDDIVIYSKTLDDHINHIKLVINQLTQNKFKLNLSKCKFGVKGVYLLGHYVTGSGVQVDERKIIDLGTWEPPTTGKQLEKHLGFFNYFRQYIDKYSDIAAPLEKFRKKESLKEVWSEEQSMAWNQLKQSIYEAKMLYHPDFDSTFHIQTDASNVGISASIFQYPTNENHPMIDKHKRRYISFAARALSASEKNYSTTKKELLAIIFALKKFHYYVAGRRFKLYTDHKPLIQLMTMKPSTSMLSNWIDLISRYDIELHHVSGKDNVLADNLSRLYPEIKLIETSEERDTQLIEDENEQSELIDKIHLLGGHFGINATLRKLKSEGYTWSNMRQTIQKKLKSCPECRKFTIGKHGFHPLNPIHATLPFDHIAMDLAGPLPVSYNHSYILIIVDINTKFVIIKSLKDKTTQSVCKQLLKIFTTFGFPKIIQSDNGKEFTSGLLKNLTELCNIDKRVTSPYHPRANGIAERNIRTMFDILRKRIESEEHEWYDQLPVIQYEHKNQRRFLFITLCFNVRKRCKQIF
jgi:predicted aspartyl protease